MANLGSLLGSFMQNAMSQSGESRLGNVLQDLQTGAGARPDGGGGFGNALGGGLGGALGGGLGGALGGDQGGGLGGILGNVLDMAKGAAGSAGQNPLQAAGLGAVLGSVLGGGGDSISGAVKGGALALLAGVAYKALTGAGQASGQGTAAAMPLAAAPSQVPPQVPPQVPVELQGPRTPDEEQLVERKAELVIKGMLNVAKSDGEVSAEEILRITSQLREAGMDAEAESWLMDELRRPLDLEAFIAEIPDAQTAAEIYAASLLAVEIDTLEERAYLAGFARGCGIDGPVARQIEQTLGVQV